MIEVICNINKYGYKLIMSNINFNKNNTICLIETFSIKKKKETFKDSSLPQFN